MAINPKSFTNLDIFEYKDSIKAFLQSQAEFADANFEGSALSILLDVLAYNTQYNAFQFNMVASEMFLDTATRRSSVVSIAKALGYTPQSRKSASAIVYLRFTPSVGEVSCTLPAGTKFSTKIDNDSYIFSTQQDYTVGLSDTGTFEFTEVEIFEGRPLTHRFSVNAKDVVYTIPNVGIDTDRLIVRVRDSATSGNTTLYTKAREILGVTGNSEVYFVEEVDSEKFAIRFGDDVIGKKLSVGNVVEITYVVSSSSEANGATIFSLTSTIAGTDQLAALETLSPAIGGREIESIDSIKKFAPENYSVQNRAVTALDYARIITREVPSAEAISVWGGEDNVPPQYGYVYIAIKPETGAYLTSTKKAQIENSILKKYNILTVIPRVVDPDYVYLGVNSLVKYDSTKTELGAGDIKSKVIDAILEFSDNDLEKFNTYFKFSRFVSAIDDADYSIESNETTVSLIKTIYIQPLIGYAVSFNNPIKTGSITSSTFTYNGVSGCSLYDEGTGKASVVNNSGTVAKDAVTINYAVGSLSIPTVALSSSDGTLRVFATSTTQDIALERLFLGQILPEDISVTVQNVSRTNTK